MKKQLKIGTESVEYLLRQRVSGSIRMTINSSGNMTVSVPIGMPQMFVDRFLHSKADWILTNLAKIKQRAPVKNSAELERQYIRYRPLARRLARERLEYFNQFYGFKYEKISIRNQSSRWGSCSASGTLSFNYRIALVDPQMADFVIVHELCHTKEMNHSPRFWGLVAKTLPNYKQLQRKFRQFDLNTI